MRRTLILLTVMIGSAVSALAQQHPIFDVDAFIDPREREGTVFISRLLVGAARNFIDDARPLGQDAAFVRLLNNVYWKRVQFDYDHTEMRGENDARVFRCGCSPPVYFPTPPPPNAIPAAPPLGSRDSLQLGWYRNTKRFRVMITRQTIDTTIRSVATQQVVERRSGHEQSIGFDADTHTNLRGVDVWGSLFYAHTRRNGTIDHRTQQVFAYTARPAGWAVGPMLARATLTVAGVTNRGGTAINVVNPAVEAFFHSSSTEANIHLVWSPATMRDGVSRWRTRHQIALFVDRALFVHIWHPLR